MDSEERRRLVLIGAGLSIPHRVRNLDLMNYPVMMPSSNFMAFHGFDFLSELVTLGRVQSRLLPSGLKTVVDLSATTVWILWPNDLPRIWNIMLEWSCGSMAQAFCAGAILRMGLEKKRISPESAMDTITEWLDSRHQRNQRAGEQLVGELPIEMIVGAANTLGDEKELGKKGALIRLVRHLFVHDIYRAIRLMQVWTEQDRIRFDPIIKEILKGADLPAHLTAPDCQAIDKMLKALETKVHVARSSVKNIRKKAHAILSKLSNPEQLKRSERHQRKAQIRTRVMRKN